LTEDIKSIARKLSPEKRNETKFVLISIDPERDSVEKLKNYFQAHKLDGNWTLLTGSKSAVRELAAALGVQYNKRSNGDFNHSNLITLLDEEGVVLTQLQGLGADQQEFVKALESVAKRGP